MSHRSSRRARAAWLVLFLGLIGAPAGAAATLAPDQCGELWEALSVHTGLVAFGLLVLGLLLVSRLPSLMATLGIEGSLRLHRVVAVSVVVLVVAHVVLVLLTDPRGLSILDLRHTTPAARAAVTATVALGLIVALGLRRRRRQPRYEGWRMLHLALALVAIGAAWLHVWWLAHLRSNLLIGGWFVLVALLVVGVLVRRWLLLPMRARRRAYVVEHVVPASKDAVTVSLAAHGHAGIAFRPGQFAWLKLGHSPFVFEDHPFSIASTALAPHRKEFTVKALGDFSELLSGLRPGRTVFVDGAYGGMTTHGRDAAAGFVFVAGGIGITPMASMLRTLVDLGDRRPHLLFIAARTPEEMLLRSELVALRDRLDLTVVDVVAQAPEMWVGEVGRIDLEVLDRWLPRRSRRHLEYFVCGPPAMVTAVGEDLRRLGVRQRRIHTERFEVV